MNGPLLGRLIDDGALVDRPTRWLLAAICRLGQHDMWPEDERAWVWRCVKCGAVEQW